MIFVILLLVNSVFTLPKPPADLPSRPQEVKGCKHSSWCCRKLFKKWIDKEKELDSKRSPFHPLKRAANDPYIDSTDSDWYGEWTGRFTCVDTRSKATVLLRGEVDKRGPYILKCDHEDEVLVSTTARSYRGLIGKSMRRKVYCTQSLDIVHDHVRPGTTRCLWSYPNDWLMLGQKMVIQAGIVPWGQKPTAWLHVYNRSGKRDETKSRDYGNDYEGTSSWTILPEDGNSYHFCVQLSARAEHSVVMTFDLIEPPPNGIAIV